MSTTIEVTSNSAEETESIGARLGEMLRGGEVIELVSDLGGGKTTFVRGLAKGLGSTDRVASPTFTVSKQYKAKDKLLVHYDFYRLEEPGIMAHELAEYINDPHVVTVVEWGEIVSKVFPQHKLSIHIKRTGDDQRKFEISLPKELLYLEKGFIA